MAQAGHGTDADRGGRLTTETICARFDLPRPAQALPRAGVSPLGFFASLVAAQQYLAAIDFIAHAVPARDAVWWGALCLQHAFGGALPPAERAAAHAAVLWLLQPNEANRTAAARTAGMSAAGMLATAVGQTGGSLVPPPAQPVPPPPFAPAKSVGTAIRLATLKAAPAAMPQTQKAYAELGLSIAQGRCPIPDASGWPGLRRAS